MRLPTPASDTIEQPPITGKGIWRAHPRLAASPEFCAKLKGTISDSIASLLSHWSAQDKWDTIKSVTISVAKKFSRRQTSHLKSVEKLLHHKRASLTNSVSRFADNAANLRPQLSVIESQLASIQQYHAETLALRSGIRWREMGEISAGYLKRTIAQRQSRQKISKLIHPTTDEICTSPTELQAAARAFYSDLYSPDPINDGAVQNILSSVPSPLRLSAGDQDFLTSPIEWDDLMEQVRRCPNKSSPGLDGIPYEILRLLFTHPDCKLIILQVYNDGLTQGIFPLSWSRNCVSLLPKKGDLSDLKNWRPISLINTDAKVFTRILNSRIILCADTLITPFQSGFVQGRFIADNGLLMKLVMEHARLSNSSAIGLLIDQEKAYDRIHPDYLRQVLQRFAFPDSIINSISSLFFSTELQLNINGFLSDPIPQSRGLRQGDPLSPVLFNLAFEPLLRSILNDQNFKGFQLPRSPLSASSPEASAPVKLMAYADDVVCFLEDPEDLTILHNHLSTYSRASNAKVNFHKTEAFSLSGSSGIYQLLWRSHLHSHNIYSWHDRCSSSCIVYLGFPLYTSVSQRNQFLDKIIQSIVSACGIHSHRSLSVRGRVTILNSLILSRLWHVLRVLSVPQSFLKRIQSAVSSFVNFRQFPKIGFTSLCTSRRLGGLSVLDPAIQQGVLQLRWLLPLLALSLQPQSSTFWTESDIGYSFVLPRLVDFFLYHCLPNHGSTSPDYDYRIQLLFAHLRPKALRHIDSSFRLLFFAMDMLPRPFEDVVIASRTAMCLFLPTTLLCPTLLLSCLLLLRTSLMPLMEERDLDSLQRYFHFLDFLDDS
ncbi:hypothetical protein G6F62_008320 [Rhizopus arrhizus]|nr:hypothetical protein G6F24_011684 [Rhizopus arrhizus]KAG0906542.1 hypothetical protein G6F33_011292 [Rhizopus arrhizus]KAG1122636.1 hypothetical protein G6F42_011292 [Rhizopus arrhizus]KAG1325876.1 hypothetical protein G6F62_008320 [Rhizopus arrhizus]KAG1373769.1 hypothetical protein G6F61_009900 [Rhizopus arrhizus]